MKALMFQESPPVVRDMPVTGSNVLPPLSEFSLYEVLHYNSYVNYEGRTITYKLIAPVRKRIS